MQGVAGDDPEAVDLIKGIEIGGDELLAQPAALDARRDFRQSEEVADPGIDAQGLAGAEDAGFVFHRAVAADMGIIEVEHGRKDRGADQGQFEVAADDGDAVIAASIDVRVEISGICSPHGEIFEDRDVEGVHRAQVDAQSDQIAAPEVADGAFKPVLAEVEIQLQADLAIVVRGFIGEIIDDKTVAKTGGIEGADAGIGLVHLAAVAEVAQKTDIVVAAVPVPGAYSAALNIVEQIDVQADTDLAKAKFRTEGDRKIVSGLPALGDAGETQAPHKAAAFLAVVSHAAIVILG
ncbi:MAG: hypothetical protein BWY77_01442 [bacterium ADurb.Bin431]|nr:MAG: hypothetical protein BWY77_01442 [bacterium ADurb.Bin431]